MSSDFDVELQPPRRTPIAPQFQLRLSAIFWRACVIAFLVREYAVWRFVSKFVPREQPIRRFLGFLYHSQKSFPLAILIGVGVTLAIWLGFRLFVRPLMRRWYHPRPLDPTYSHPLPFYLAPGEEPLAEWPARRLDGLTRHPGTFVRTNRNLWFFPFSWEQEAWSAPLDRLAFARAEPTVRRVLGLVRGYPDHVALTDAGGSTFRIIVADPESVLGSLHS